MERKVTASGAAAAAVTILAVILRDAAGYQLSAEAQGAVTTLAVFMLGYLVPNKPARPSSGTASPPR